MSSVGQAIGGIVGGVVGFFTPLGPMYGAQIGMMIGGVLDPPKTEGPRLEDLTSQTSTYGAFIPRMYGTAAVNGNVFWIQGDKLIESSTTEGGKGGPEVTTFQYAATFAVGLCEGPVDGVRRIWIGGQLWYDAGSDDLSTIIASNENAGTFTLYTGTDTQAADPLIQADRGAANVPAYRGIAYIVFDQLPLEKYGNSLMGAQVKVEVAKVGATGYVVTGSTLGGGAAWRAVCKSQTTYCAIGTTAAATSFDGQTWELHAVEVVDWASIAWNGTVFCAVADGVSSRVAVSPNGYVWDYYDIDVVTARVAVAWGAGVFFSPGRATDRGYYSKDGISWTRVTLPASSYWSAVAWNGTVFCCVSSNGSTNVMTSSDGVTWALGAMPAALDWAAITWNGEVFCAVANSTASNAFATSPDGVTWTTRSPPAGVPWTSICWNGNRFFVTAYPSAAAAVSEDGVTWATVAVPGHFWRASFGDGFFGAIANNGETLLVVNPFTPGAESLADIVESECLQSGLLTAGDLDVTELIDSVRGYRISSLAPLRGGIDPLRKAWPFDAIQHGYKIKFKKRGGASVATVTEGELDARAAGANPGVRISNVREMDLIMPQQLTVQYLDAAREYDVNVAEESR